jgi:hypothetical protein
MDRWLNGAPALAYVKELGIWVVLNNNGKIMVWTADAAEVDWLSLWLLEYKKNAKPDLRITSNTGGRKLSRVSIRRRPLRQWNKVDSGSKNSDRHDEVRKENLNQTTPVIKSSSKKMIALLRTPVGGWRLAGPRRRGR